MKQNSLVTLGIWAWGTATALLGVIVVYVILTGTPPAIYFRIKEAATALGAVVAASALAWSHFFQTGSRREETQKLEDLSKVISELSRKIDRLSDKNSLGGNL